MFSQHPEPARATTYCKVLLALLFGALTLSAQALPEDANQPIHVTADQALHNEKQGFTVYNGHVEMEQGSLRISADKITIYRMTDEADKIVAKGQPAQMQQQPEPGKGPIKAQAGVIEYYKTEARIHLRIGAQIEQDGSTVRGETIDYYIDDQLVKAGSNRSREDSRVEVVIPAQSIRTSEGERGEAKGK
jgi:lipopolysaccharide export system protein LptA